MPDSISALTDLLKQSHDNARAAGWHDKPRPFVQDILLLISEVGEAIEGLRKQCVDQHLPKYPMFWVELADIFIRLGDTCGLWLVGQWECEISICLETYHFVDVDLCTYTDNPPDVEDIPDILVDTVNIIINAYGSFTSLDRKKFTDSVDYSFSVLISSLLSIDAIPRNSFPPALRKDVQLKQIIEEKLAYNQTRNDHSLTVRNADGGKKW